MSDYSKTTDFAAKDSLPSGNPNKIIKGADIDTEFNNIATASESKANKLTSVTLDNVLSMDASGDLKDSGIASGNVVTLAGTQTLTNKTISGGTISGGTISNVDDIGVGTAPYAWGADNNVIDLGPTGGVKVPTSNGILSLIENAYHNGTNWLYKTNGYAGAIDLYSTDGTFRFTTAPSGVAGNVATFSELLKLDTAGNLTLNNGSGLVSTLGATLQTGPGGGTWQATAAAAPNTGLVINGYDASQSGALLALYNYNGGLLRFSIGPDGTVNSYKSAASGYTRVTPNYCKRDNGNTSTGLATGSTAVAAPSADAKAVEVEVEVYAGSQNAVGSRYSFVKGYTDAGLTLIQGRVHIQIYEVTAISGVILGGATGTILINLSSPGASLYLDFAHSPGSTAIYRVVGYYD